jgi:hypothetical protein
VIWSCRLVAGLEILDEIASKLLASKPLATIVLDELSPGRRCLRSGEPGENGCAHGVAHPRPPR